MWSKARNYRHQYAGQWFHVLPSRLRKCAFSPLETAPLPSRELATFPNHDLDLDPDPDPPGVFPCPSLPQKTEHKTRLPEHICLKTLPRQQKLHTWSHFKE